jgi:hypothetical protein
MKKSFKNYFAFFFTVSIISIVLFSAINFFYKQKLQKSSFNRNITTVICGDSHPMCAINDSILNQAVNVSSFSQHYMYTYNILHVLLENNSSIQSVILGTSFHSFNEYDKYVFDDDYARLLYPNYLPILDMESAKLIISNNYKGFFSTSDEVIKLMIKSILRSNNSYYNYPFIGQYHQSENSNLNDTTVSKAINRHFYKANGVEQGFALYQKKYFDKIVHLCLSKNIKLIIVNTPLSEEYYTKVPKKFISNYYTIIAGLQNKIEFWDYHNYSLQNSCFGDGDHLNSFGANIFSMTIDSLLNNRIESNSKN